MEMETSWNHATIAFPVIVSFKFRLIAKRQLPNFPHFVMRFSALCSKVTGETAETFVLKGRLELNEN
jgi:hypothetical protein